MPDIRYPIPNTHFRIIGFGRFGQLALARLTERFSSAKFSVADKRPEKFVQITDHTIRMLAVDGVSGLRMVLADMQADDWVIPAIPLHVAYEWLRLNITETYQLETVDVPDEILESLPNPIRGDTQACYTSVADFICPDDCLEPESLCTCTGRPRTVVLHEALVNIVHPEFRPMVIVSRQLAPGVGGYRVSDLDAVLTKITEHPGPYVLATACKCHGVMHALRVTRLYEGEI